MTEPLNGRRPATEHRFGGSLPSQSIRREFAVSFEFFPPSDEDARGRLSATASRLAAYAPEFMSVTYGAGGSTRERTHATIARLRESTTVPVAGHLTCVAASTGETQRTVDRYAAAGVTRIVALRGDPPGDDANHATGYPDAAALVSAIRSRPDGDRFDISVAAYPETHPQAESPRADLDNLKRKLDAGADRALTQFFFDSEVFLRFLERARRAGITAPIVPGIMPIVNFGQIRRFARRCGARIPEAMAAMFDGVDDNPEGHREISARITAEQCRLLGEHGIRQFHFYTMNRPELTAAACQTLGIEPDPLPCQVAS